MQGRRCICRHAKMLMPLVPGLAAWVIRLARTNTTEHESVRHSHCRPCPRRCLHSPGGFRVPARDVRVPALTLPSVAQWVHTPEAVHVLPVGMIGALCEATICMSAQIQHPDTESCAILHCTMTRTHTLLLLDAIAALLADR